MIALARSSERNKMLRTAPRVLIMGTDALSRGSLGSWLKRHGCHICEAEHQMEARTILHEQEVDVVLLGLNDYGTDSLSIIRGISRSSRAPAFILLTDPPNIRLSMEGMKLGAFDALTVPVDVNLLVERISAACSGRRKALGRHLEIAGKVTRGRSKSLRSFLDAVGLNKAKGRFGVARFP
ncbi:MAG: response regulator [Deltaproteobacteria bacterium]|nr:response regulator [Deltaproteobacteria bacterium]